MNASIGDLPVCDDDDDIDEDGDDDTDEGVDEGPPATDAGADAGAPEDIGSPEQDAGAPEEDAGPPSTDAGGGDDACDADVPEEDSGSPERDSGVPEDSGSPEQDGGSPPNLGCTLTQGYWKNHPEAWPVSTLTINAAVYTQAQLLSILRTPPRGDASIALFHQLIAALLNIGAGAYASDEVIAAIEHAITLLGDPASSHEDLAASNEALTAFNDGLSGTPHCDH